MNINNNGLLQPMLTQLGLNNQQAPGTADGGQSVQNQVAQTTAETAETGTNGMTTLSPTNFPGIFPQILQGHIRRHRFNTPNYAAGQGIRARQVVDENGVPQSESTLRIRLPQRGFELTDPTALSIQSNIANPADGSEGLVPMNILGAELGPRGRFLTLNVDGPISNGSQISFGDGALTRNGEAFEMDPVTLNNGRKFMSPERAALWGKAYEPSNIDLFPEQTYPGASPAVGIPQSTDPAVIKADLAQHFDSAVAAGELRQRRADRLLNRFDSNRVQQVFTNPDTGVFEPTLAAATLALAGTPGNGAISAIIGGNNETGRPAQVVYGDLEPGLAAGAAVFTDENGQDQWRITVSNLFRDEPFQALAPTIAHEAMHQDNVVGQDEELVANSVEINTWKNMLLINPDYANFGTRLTKAANLKALWHENSGATGFPNGGFFQADQAQDPPNINPNSNFVDPSLESVLRLINGDVPDVDTPGNRFLDRFVSRVTPGRSRGLGFNDGTLTMLDNPSRAFRQSQNFQILQALQLQPVFA